MCDQFGQQRHQLLLLIGAERLQNVLLRALDLWRAAAADGDAAFDLVLIASDGRTFVTDGIADAYTPAAGTNAQVVRS